MIEMYFDSQEPVIDWLKAGAPMPDGGEITHFGDGERPVRKPQFEIADQRRYAEYLRRRGYGATLFGARFFVCASPSERVPSEISFYPFESRSEKKKAEHEAALLALAHELFQRFDARGAVYGFAGEHEEWRHYNLYKWPCSRGSQRFNTSPSGKDFKRYVPGVYWMNYFSNAYADSRRIAIEPLAATLGGEVTRCPNGVIWRAFPDHRQWREHASKLADFVAGDDRFFSLRRLPPVPDGLSPPEEMAFMHKLWVDWR